MVEEDILKPKVFNTSKNQYLLIGDRRNQSWQIRTHGLFITDPKGKRRELRYCEGESSIYKDMQNKDSQETFLWMQYGSLLVDPNDKTLNNFLQAHPHFNEKFFLYDELKESEEALEELEFIQGVRVELAKTNEEQREAIATMLWGLESVASWSEKKIKLELLKYMEDNPKELLKIIKDPATEMAYVIAGAIKMNVIYIEADRTAVCWSDTNQVITTVPQGVQPLNEMCKFLLSDKGLSTLQAIGNKMKDEEASTKPKTAAKK